MKKLIIILILLCAVTVQAQNYGTSRAKKAYMTYAYIDTVMSNIVFDKIVQMDSTTNIKMPYGVYSDTTSQVVVSVTGRYGVKFSNNDEVYRITHTAGDSLFTIQEAGVYFITISAIADLKGGVNGHLNLWLYVDGMDISRSNTRLAIPTASIEMVLAVSYIYSFRAGQTFSIMYNGDDTNVELSYTPASLVPPPIPSSPSIIMTINKIGALQ